MEIIERDIKELDFHVRCKIFQFRCLFVYVCSPVLYFCIVFWYRRKSKRTIYGYIKKVSSWEYWVKTNIIVYKITKFSLSYSRNSTPFMEDHYKRFITQEPTTGVCPELAGSFIYIYIYLVTFCCVNYFDWIIQNFHIHGLQLVIFLCNVISKVSIFWVALRFLHLKKLRTVQHVCIVLHCTTSFSLAAWFCLSSPQSYHSSSIHLLLFRSAVFILSARNSVKQTT